MRLSATLQHPNLLPLFDSGDANGLLYDVMPYLDGETRRARMDRERQLPFEDAVRIAIGIAQALAYAHARGVIHRDLKPQNISRCRCCLATSPRRRRCFVGRHFLARYCP